MGHVWLSVALALTVLAVEKARSAQGVCLGRTASVGIGSRTRSSRREPTSTSPRTLGNVEVLAGVSRHRLNREMAALRASNGGLEDELRHALEG
jgi:hypothetical protein